MEDPLSTAATALPLGEVLGVCSAGEITNVIAAAISGGGELAKFTLLRNVNSAEIWRKCRVLT